MTLSDSEPLRPGPLGLPLLLQIQQDPLAAASRLQRQCGDVARLNILFRRIYYFFNPEAARQILVEQQASFTREARQLKVFQGFQGRNVFTTEGTHWERQRRILTPGFSAKRIVGYMSLMSEAIADRIRSELPAEPGCSLTLDVSALMTHLTMDVILRTLFSHAASKAEAGAISSAIRALTRQSMQELFWAFIPPKWLPYPGRTEKLRNLRTIDTLIATHIDARTGCGAEARQDVLSMMLEARDDEPAGGSATLTSAEIHANCIVLFGAGFDTSASALTWWVGLVASHPEAAARLRQELDRAYADTPTLEGIARLPYLNATLKEAMRLYPPSTALLTRVAVRDVTIADTPVPRGTLVVTPVWHLHHDARYFPDAEAFRPERFLPGAPPIPRGAYLPFGAGSHFCLGQHFATVEMALAAAQLARQFELSLEEGAVLPEPFVDLALKPKTSLRVRFTRRDGAAVSAAA